MKKDISPTQRMMNAYFQQFKGKKVRRVGQWCRQCAVPVIEHALSEAEIEEIANTPQDGYRKHATFYAWWLECPRCHTRYYREEGKCSYRTPYDNHLSSILREE